MTTIDSVASLGEGFSGEALTPGDPGYDAARTIPRQGRPVTPSQSPFASH